MCSPVHVHMGGRKLRMRSKANNFIGGLHNSADIPGVIVLPLRLSCRDESLMHSCLRIMDGTGQPLPSPAAETWEWGRNEWESSARRPRIDCGQRARWTKRGTCSRVSARISVCLKYVSSPRRLDVYCTCVSELRNPHNDLLHVYRLNFPR